MPASPASSSAAHVALQVVSGLAGAALITLGVIQKDHALLGVGCSLLLGDLAGSHVGQALQAKLPAIQKGVSTAEQFLPVILPFLSPKAQALIKAGDAGLDEVLAELLAAQAKAAGVAAGGVPQPPAGGPSQA